MGEISYYWLWSQNYLVDDEDNNKGYCVALVSLMYRFIENKGYVPNEKKWSGLVENNKDFVFKAQESSEEGVNSGGRYYDNIGPYLDSTIEEKNRIIVDINIVESIKYIFKLLDNGIYIILGFHSSEFDIKISHATSLFSFKDEIFFFDPNIGLVAINSYHDVLKILSNYNFIELKSQYTKAKMNFYKNKFSNATKTHKEVKRYVSKFNQFKDLKKNDIKETLSSHSTSYKEWVYENESLPPYITCAKDLDTYPSILDNTSKETNFFEKRISFLMEGYQLNLLDKEHLPSREKFTSPFTFKTPKARRTTKYLKFQRETVDFLNVSTDSS